MAYVSYRDVQRRMPVAFMRPLRCENEQLIGSRVRKEVIAHGDIKIDQQQSSIGTFRVKKRAESRMDASVPAVFAVRSGRVGLVEHRCTTNDKRQDEHLFAALGRARCKADHPHPLG